MRILLKTMALAALMAVLFILTPTPSHAADSSPATIALPPEQHAPPPAAQDGQPAQAPSDLSQDTGFGAPQGEPPPPSPTAHDGFNDPPPHNADMSPPQQSTEGIERKGDNPQTAQLPTATKGSDETEGNRPPPTTPQDSRQTGTSPPLDDRPHGPPSYKGQ